MLNRFRSWNWIWWRDEEHEKFSRKGKEGYRCCLEVKTYTWLIPPSKPKNWCRFSYTHQWLRSAVLMVETDRLIVAVQDQSLFTRNFQANILHNGADSRWRFCNTSTNATDHFVSACTILAKNEYTNRHNRVGQYTLENL